MRLSTYVDSLSDRDKLAVAYSDSNNSFRFGDGRQVQSTSTARFPTYLGSKRVFIVSDVVDLDIPLLFSRVSMKNAKMNINFEQNTVKALHQELPLSLTQDGRYILPLSPSTQLIQEFNQPTFQDTDTVTLHVCEITGDDTNVASIASKLHRQFAHAPAQHMLRNLCLVSHAGSPWANNSALKTQIHQTVDNCSTCNLYKKPPPRPVVGLPLATRFQETVAMDLKFYSGKIILHLIDHATRLSTTVHIPSKQPKVILNAILSNWISVYRAAEKFLSDNGGEFVNE